jgi:hypothetical protein
LALTMAAGPTACMESSTVLRIPTDISSYCRYGVNKAQQQSSFPPTRAFDTAALRVSKNKRAKGDGRRRLVAVPTLAHFLPLACRCESCCLLLMPAIGAAVPPAVAPAAAQKKPKNSELRTDREQAPPKDAPQQVSVTVYDLATRSFQRKMECMGGFSASCSGFDELSSRSLRHPSPIYPQRPYHACRAHIGAISSSFSPAKGLHSLPFRPNFQPESFSICPKTAPSLSLPGK